MRFAQNLWSSKFMFKKVIFLLFIFRGFMLMKYRWQNSLLRFSLPESGFKIININVYIFFTCPSLTGRINYGIASSVCLSVCLSGPCRPNRLLQDLTTWYSWSVGWKENTYCFSRSEVNGQVRIVTSWENVVGRIQNEP